MSWKRVTRAIATGGASEAVRRRDDRNVQIAANLMTGGLATPGKMATEGTAAAAGYRPAAVNKATSASEAGAIKDVESIKKSNAGVADRFAMYRANRSARFQDEEEGTFSSRKGNRRQRTF